MSGLVNGRATTTPFLFHLRLPVFSGNHDPLLCSVLSRSCVSYFTRPVPTRTDHPQSTFAIPCVPIHPQPLIDFSRADGVASSQLSTPAAVALLVTTANPPPFSLHGTPRSRERVFGSIPLSFLFYRTYMRAHRLTI